MQYLWHTLLYIGKQKNRFYSKDAATNAYIANTNNFKLKYKAKLLGNTEAQPETDNVSGILKNATIAVPLKCLCNFWKSLEMPLINCKIGLKLKWTKYCSVRIW